MKTLRERPAPAGMKLCNSCGEYKPATPEFFHRHSTYGFQSECKLCLNQKNRERYHLNPRARRTENRVRYYTKRGRKPPVEKTPRIRKPAETRLEKEIEAFLAARKNLAPKTLEGYTTTLFDLAEAYPEFPPTPQGVTDYLAEKGGTAESKRTRYAKIRAFCHWLRKTKRVNGDPLEGIIRPRKEEILPRAPKEYDIKKVFDYLENEVERHLQCDPLSSYRAARDLAAFSLMLDSGLRVSEVCNLDLSDIDFDECSALIRHAKSRRERFVMFGRRVKGNLRLWLRVRAELGIPDNIPALFISEHGGWRRPAAQSFRQCLVQYCQSAGAKRFSPHQLRHAHASQSIKNGQDIEQLRQQMGHSDVTMTARYFKLPSEKRKVGHFKTSPLDNLGRAA